MTVTRFPGADRTGAPSGSGVSSDVTVTVTVGVEILKDWRTGIRRASIVLAAVVMKKSVVGFAAAAAAFKASKSGMNKKEKETGPPSL